MKPTPRKDTVIFRANWVKILVAGIYRVVDEDKYHGHVFGHTLLRPRPLRVKCETNTQHNHLNAVRDVLVERERMPSAQLWQALPALKENVDTQMRVSPSHAFHRGR